MGDVMGEITERVSREKKGECYGNDRTLHLSQIFSLLFRRRQRTQAFYMVFKAWRSSG